MTRAIEAVFSSIIHLWPKLLAHLQQKFLRRIFQRQEFEIRLHHNRSIKNWRLSFWALIVTQFQGAFSLNVLRYLLTFMVLGTAMPHVRSDGLVSLITVLFFVPLVIFSMAGGFLADRYSKRQVTIATKIIEIAAMVVAIFSLSATGSSKI